MGRRGKRETAARNAGHVSRCMLVRAGMWLVVLDVPCMRLTAHTLLLQETLSVC